MLRRPPKLIAVACAALLLGAQPCSAQTATPLTAPASRLSAYQRVLIDPIEITAPDKEHWQDVSAQLRQQALKQTHEEFSRAIGMKLALADKAAADTLRLHLKVENVRLSKPVAASLGHILPVGLLLSAARSATGASAPKTMGQVSISGELRDAQTDALLASFTTHQGPDALDIGSAVSQQAAMKAAIARTADRFTEALIKARTLEPDCGIGGETSGPVHLMAADCPPPPSVSGETPR